MANYQIKVPEIKFPLRLEPGAVKPIIPDWAGYSLPGEKPRYYVYKIWRIGTRDDKYIGCTNNLHNRFKDYNKNNHYQPIAKAIKKYGWHNFAVYIMAIVPSKAEARDIERKLIKETQAWPLGYNANRG